LTKQVGGCCCSRTFDKNLTLLKIAEDEGRNSFWMPRHGEEQRMRASGYLIGVLQIGIFVYALLFFS
jgi:hypothetical protein